MPIDKRKKILIIGGLPAEAGGRGHDGLSYSIWNNTRNLKTDRFNITILADNVLPKDICVGEVPQVPFSPLHLWTARNNLASTFYRTIHKQYIRESVKSIAKCLWYSNAIKTFEPDLIHVHGALRACFLAASSPDVPVLTTLHGTMVIPASDVHPFAEIIESDALEVSYCLVTVTERTFHRLQCANIYHNPRWVIPDGVDRQCMNNMSKGTRSPDGHINLLTVGSLTRNKNQLAVIRAISLCGYSSKYVYTTIGKGPLRSKLEVEARLNGVKYVNIPSIDYSDLPEYYRSADYHVLLSLSEGFGMCVAESLACGTPVIVSKSMDICGEKGIIRHDNSLQVDPTNHEELAMLLGRVARDEVSFREDSINYPFSWQDISRKYEDLYLDLTSYT